MDKQKAILALQTKEALLIRVPVTLDINSSKAECYFVELLDCIAAYFKPVEYGLWKEDLLDYFETMPDVTFEEFLHNKRYIVYVEDFSMLYTKYFFDCTDDSAIIRVCSTNYCAFEKAVKEKMPLLEMVKLFS